MDTNGTYHGVCIIWVSALLKQAHRQIVKNTSFIDIKTTTDRAKRERSQGS